MDDQTFGQAEREFYEAFVKILMHLKERAIKAEAEVERLNGELAVRREQVEYLGGKSEAA